jgi:hypothetical protein
MTIQVPELDGLWPTAIESPIGVNGRGVRRPGSTKTIGGRTVVSGTDVSNQASETTKD